MMKKMAFLTWAAISVEIGAGGPAFADLNPYHEDCIATLDTAYKLSNSYLEMMGHARKQTMSASVDMNDGPGRELALETLKLNDDLASFTAKLADTCEAMRKKVGP